MKPVFGIDITDNKKNTDTNAAPFVTATNEGGQLEHFEEGQEELLHAEDRTQMPFLLRLVKWLCGFFAVAVALGVIKAESPAVAFQNAPYLIVGAGVAALLWAVLQYLSVKKKRDALADGGVEQQIEDTEPPTWEQAPHKAHCQNQSPTIYNILLSENEIFFCNILYRVSG